jgi:hypothetical protein
VSSEFHRRGGVYGNDLDGGCSRDLRGHLAAKKERVSIFLAADGGMKELHMDGTYLCFLFPYSSSSGLPALSLLLKDAAHVPHVTSGELSARATAISAHRWVQSFVTQ